MSFGWYRKWGNNKNRLHRPETLNFVRSKQMRNKLKVPSLTMYSECGHGFLFAIKVKEYAHIFNLTTMRIIVVHCYPLTFKHDFRTEFLRTTVSQILSMSKNKVTFKKLYDERQLGFFAYTYYIYV